MSTILRRRTVQTIKEILEPKKIFDLITSKEVDYSVMYKSDYPIRDRAGMSLAFETGGRVTEIFGGKQFKRIHLGERTITTPVGRHIGLKRENIEITDKFLFIRNMIIVKRSPKVIAKYGPQVALRDTLAFPLQRGLYSNIFYDQLVPFTWLIVEYIRTCAPEHGKLFLFEDTRAWQIIREITGMFPNWFRTQADNFYGHYIWKDSVKHSKFIGRVDAESSMPYIRYDWSEDLTKTEMSMNFDWIDVATNKIRDRLEGAI